jgi:hypothetical protein
MEINNRHFLVENEEKYNYVNKLQSIKPLLKLHHLKPYSEIETGITESFLSIKGFFALCLFEKINAIMVDGRKIYEFVLDETSPVHIIHHDTTTHVYSIEHDNSLANLEKYRTQYYKVQGFESNPLKSITSYTLAELKDLCIKLNIAIDEPKQTKKDLYSRIVQTLI